jgi:hypothetical protein
VIRVPAARSLTVRGLGCEFRDRCAASAPQRLIESHKRDPWVMTKREIRLIPLPEGGDEYCAYPLEVNINLPYCVGMPLLAFSFPY